jgi:hypothetical protein
VTDPKRGFDLAFAAACQAEDFETIEIHLGHAMEDLYRLYELAKKPPPSKAARDGALAQTDEGRTALAVVWARKFRTHESMELSQAADLFSNYFTNLFGVLAWRPRSEFGAGEDGDRGWHAFYDTYLDGRSVLDTLQTAVSAIGAQLRGVAGEPE